jgi:hypothetical protein
MKADKQRDEILKVFMSICVEKLNKDKKENPLSTTRIFDIVINIDELIATHSLKMKEDVLANHLRYFNITGFTIGSIDGTTNRIFRQITEKGYEAYLGEYFLEIYKNGKREKEMHKSQINTNFWMRGATIVIAVATVIGVVFQFKSCSNKESPAAITINNQSQAISLSTKSDTSRIIHSYNHGVLKALGCPYDSSVDSIVSSK